MLWVRVASARRDLRLLHRHLVALALRAVEGGAQLDHALARLLDGEGAPGELGLTQLHLALELRHPALDRVERGGRRRIGRLRLVELALRDVPVLDQATEAILLARGLHGIAARARDLGGDGGQRRAPRLEPRPRLVHRRLGGLLGDARRLERGRGLFALRLRRLPGELRLRPHRLEARRGHRHCRLRLVDLGLVVTRIDAQEHLAGLDGLVVLDGQAGHVTRHLGGERRDRALDVGVVGRHVALGVDPGIGGPGDAREPDEDADDDEEAAIHPRLAHRVCGSPHGISPVRALRHWPR